MTLAGYGFRRLAFIDAHLFSSLKQESENETETRDFKPMSTLCANTRRSSVCLSHHTIGRWFTYSVIWHDSSGALGVNRMFM